MANFVHEGTTSSPTSKMKPESNVNGLFKRKNEQSTSRVNSAVFEGKSRMRKFGLKSIMGVLVLFLLLVGGVSAFILSQTGQDVRQQASGCVYWNGEAAVEGAFDNRGGIRQQCKGGLWTTPDDGNTDPSQIIAEQNANKPKAGCRNWSGDMVSHGSYDNRGGIRQQCVNGIWDTPDDGNTDPSEIIEQNKKKDERTCVMWDTGATVGAGTCDYRDNSKSLLQVCKNGLWTSPQGSDCQSPFSSTQDATHEVECLLGDTQVFSTSEGVCESAGNLIEKTERLIGGITEISESVRDAISNGFPTTFSSVASETHTIECNLGGTVTFVADSSVCLAAEGFLGGTETQSLVSVANQANPIECVVGGEVFYTDSIETCEASSGSAESNECTPNTCIHNVSAGENKWCGADGTQTGISCDTERECGGIPEYSCNSSGQKCIGGILVSDQSCSSGDKFITLAECERDNALAAVNFVGECRIGDNGYEFVIVDPSSTVTVDTDRYVPRGVCKEENRNAINAGFGDCERGDNGWEFVVDTEALQAAFQEISTTITQPQADQCPWWNPGCVLTSFMDLFREQDEPDTGSEMFDLTCSYVDPFSNNCYDYTISVPIGTKCTDGPLPGAQSTVQGSCDEVAPMPDEPMEYTCHEITNICAEYVSEWPCDDHPYSDNLQYGPCPDDDVTEPEQVTCHQPGPLCAPTSHVGSCPAGYLEGPCPAEWETVECHQPGPLCASTSHVGICPAGYVEGPCPVE